MSGAVANLAAQGVPFVLLLLVTPLLLRMLGPARYGALVLLNLVPPIAAQLDLGFVTAATRGFAQSVARGDRHEATRLLRLATGSLAIWGVLLALLYWLAREPIARALGVETLVGGEPLVFLLSAVSIPLALVNGAALVPLRAAERYATIARVQIVAGVAYWSLCAFWASHGATLSQLIGLGSAAVALTTLALFAALARHGVIARAVHPDTEMGPTLASPIDASPVSRPLLRPYLDLSAGAFIAQASSLATYHADKLLVSALLSPSAAGAYAICASIANKTLLVVAASATYTFPRSARLHAAGDPSSIVETFVVASRAALILATTMALPLIAFAPAFLRVWLGASFADQYATTLSLLALGYAIAAGAVVASNVVIGLGETRLPASFAVLGGLATLLLVTLLAPAWGVAGAAAAATLGMSQAIVFNLLVVRRLGDGARRAGGALLAQLGLVALPIGALASLANPLVDGWFGLVVAMGTTAIVFLAAWLLSFGRHRERALFDTLVLEMRHARDGH